MFCIFAIRLLRARSAIMRCVPPCFSAAMDAIMVVGTTSWFFMPISVAVSTRNSSLVM